MNNKYLSSIKSDFPASIVVFLVALPLCLGIALASNAPLFSGIIAGVVGGIVIGIISNSHVSVSGPAAGLTVIVLGAIKEINNFEGFLLCVIIAGVIQLILGFLKSGVLGDFVPSSVIKGMLSAIGIILILKQFPHLIGYDVDFEGDEAFFQPDGENTFTEIILALQNFKPIAVIIALISILIIIIWETKLVKESIISKILPAPLLVVAIGLIANYVAINIDLDYGLYGEHLVSLPVSLDYHDFIRQFHFPKFEYINNPKVWIFGLQLGIVASIESLLSIEASDNIDPQKRYTNPNRELKAQGIGNIISGFLGGLPVTAVIVRSSANVAAGGKTKFVTIFHGVLLLLAVYYIPGLLNHIPLSCLAAILIMVGFKLTKPSIFKGTFREGMNQFAPFVITILAIIFTDLLIGILIGIVAGLFFILRSNFKTSISVLKDNSSYLIRFRKDVSFLNKSFLKRKLDEIEEDSYVLIDATQSDFVDHDIIELVNDYIYYAHLKGIKVELKKTSNKPKSIFNEQTTIN